MGGKGRKGLLDALLVADIRKYTAENRDLASVCGRYHHSAHGHKGKKSDGFEGNGFAAGVGSGYDEGVKILAQSYVCGNHLFRVDKGVPRFFKVDFPAVVKHRLACLHVKGKLSLCKDDIEPYDRLVSRLYAFGKARRFRGKLRKNTVDLLPLLGL